MPRLSQLLESLCTGSTVPSHVVHHKSSRRRQPRQPPVSLVDTLRMSAPQSGQARRARPGPRDRRSGCALRHSRLARGVPPAPRPRPLRSSGPPGAAELYDRGERRAAGRELPAGSWSISEPTVAAMYSLSRDPGGPLGGKAALKPSGLREQALVIVSTHGFGNALALISSRLQAIHASHGLVTFARSHQISRRFGVPPRRSTASARISIWSVAPVTRRVA